MDYKHGVSLQEGPEPASLPEEAQVLHCLQPDAPDVPSEREKSPTQTKMIHLIKFLLRLKVISQINIVAVELSTQTS